MNPSKKIIVVGVGNPLRRDDGIGPKIINKLRRGASLPRSSVVISPFVDFFDAGTDALLLIDAIERYDLAIIIDAVDMNAVPGTVKLFTPDEAKINIKNDVLSTHGFGLAEVIKLFELLEIPTEIKILGIQPQDISYCEGLTDVVKNKIPEILEIINNVVECTHRCVLTE